MTLNEHRAKLVDELVEFRSIKDYAGICWQAWMELYKKGDGLTKLLNEIPKKDYEVFTDGVHLVSLYETDLHEFAKLIDLGREWFQDKKHPHYDLITKRKVQNAIDFGATKVQTQVLLLISKNMIRDEGV